MSDTTKIEWTDATWNPIRGVKGRHHCTKVSPACTNCYAERMNLRFSKLPYVKGADTFRLDQKALQEPLRWKQPRKVFVCSMTDLFHEDIPIEYIADVFAIISSATVDCGKSHRQHTEDCWGGERHTYQVLTKRPEHMRNVIDALPDYFAEHYDGDACINVVIEQSGWPLKNVWLGVTAENQHYADERIPLLLETPATIRFVSYEPALGPVDFSAWLHDHRECTCYEVIGGGHQMGCMFYGEGKKMLHQEPVLLDWIIAGGESGPKARTMHPGWARSVRDQCQAAWVPFFFTQWGEWFPCPLGDWQAKNLHHFNDPLPHGTNMWKVGKKAAGRLLDGREWNEFPKKDAS